MIAQTKENLAERVEILPNEDVSHLAEVFKLLGDETRLQIVLLVSRHGELNVTELCRLVDHSQPLVSHHLALLKTAGVIEKRREGKHNYYSVNRELFVQLMAALAFERQSAPPCDCFLECMLA